MAAIAESSIDITDDRLAARNALGTVVNELVFPVVVTAALPLAWGSLARRPSPV